MLPRYSHKKMKSSILLFCMAAASMLIGCGPETNEEPAKIAIARLYSISNITDSTYTVTPQEIGAATFTERDGVVVVSINATGLTPGNRHSMHLHEGSCEEPGAHWNQGTQVSFCRELNLGTAWAKPYAGDIGNIRSDEDGTGYFELATEFWRLGSNDNLDIVGKLFVLHGLEEDFAMECFQSHDHVHTNPKIACGTIELIIND